MKYMWADEWVKAPQCVQPGGGDTWYCKNGYHYNDTLNADGRNYPGVWGADGVCGITFSGSKLSRPSYVAGKWQDPMIPSPGTLAITSIENFAPFGTMIAFCYWDGIGKIGEEVVLGNSTSTGLQGTIDFDIDGESYISAGSELLKCDTWKNSSTADVFDLDRLEAIEDITNKDRKTVITNAHIIQDSFVYDIKIDVPLLEIVNSKVHGNTEYPATPYNLYSKEDYEHRTKNYVTDWEDEGPEATKFLKHKKALIKDSCVFIKTSCNHFYTSK